jgi:hypothetical protein
VVGRTGTGATHAIVTSVTAEGMTLGTEGKQNGMVTTAAGTNDDAAGVDGGREAILYTPPGVPHGFRTDHTDSADSVQIPTLPAKVHTDSVLVRTDSMLVCVDSVLICTDCMSSLQVNIRANST